AGTCLLDDAQHLRRAGGGRMDGANPRRLGAEHPVRRGGRLPPADGAHLSHFSKAAFLIQIRPESPSFVFVASTTNRMLWMPSRNGERSIVARDVGSCSARHPSVVPTKIGRLTVGGGRTGGGCAAVSRLRTKIGLLRIQLPSVWRPVARISTE